MHLITKLVLSILINFAGLMVAARWIEGFTLRGAITDIALVALVLTLLNFFLKPVLKLLFGPVILLTLGLGILIVNAVILKFLDFFSPSLSIVGVEALLLATLVLSLVNLILHFATHTRDT